MDFLNALRKVAEQLKYNNVPRPENHRDWEAETPYGAVTVKYDGVHGEPKALDWFMRAMARAAFGIYTPPEIGAKVPKQRHGAKCGVPLYRCILCEQEEIRDGDEGVENA